MTPQQIEAEIARHVATIDQLELAYRRKIGADK